MEAIRVRHQASDSDQLDKVDSFEYTRVVILREGFRGGRSVELHAKGGAGPVIDLGDAAAVEITAEGIKVFADKDAAEAAGVY